MSAQPHGPEDNREVTTVFVVEDEVLIAMELEDHLTERGYHFLGTAMHGEQAIPEIIATRPDVVLMDIHLAGKLSGIETAAVIAEHVDIPIIFLSAFSDAELLKKAREVQPFGYIIKPFEPRELHAIIQMALYKHRMERELRELNARVLATDAHENAARERRKALLRQRSVLNLLRLAQERFIASPEALPLQDLLNAAIEATESAFGFIGEILCAPEGSARFGIHTVLYASQVNRDQHAPYASEPSENEQVIDPDTIAGWVIRKGKPLVVAEPVIGAQAAGLPVDCPPFKSFLGIPIYVGTAAVGLICLADRSGGYSDSVMQELRPIIATYRSTLIAWRNVKQTAQIHVSA